MAWLQKSLVNNITWFIFQVKEVLLHCLIPHNIGYRNNGEIAYVRRGHGFFFFFFCFSLKRCQFCISLSQQTNNIDFRQSNWAVWASILSFNPPLFSLAIKLYSCQNDGTALVNEEIKAKQSVSLRIKAWSSLKRYTSRKGRQDD